MRLFFFSSRRRHTRSLRDWSSDVCSSDLITTGANALCSSEDPTGRVLMSISLSPGAPPKPKIEWCTRNDGRSEERRVGKEWIARVSSERSRMDVEGMGALVGDGGLVKRAL